MNMRFQLTVKEFIFEQQPHASCHASTLVRLTDGSFLAAWFGGTREGREDVSIWGAIRNAAGWSAPRRWARVRECAHWNPVLFVSDDGLIYLWFKVGPTIDEWATWVLTSWDAGQTWSAARELVPGDRGGRGPVKNKPIQLADGIWLAPASIETNGVWDVFVDRSHDRGRTWTASSPLSRDKSIVPDPGVIQPTLWESTPGRVHMLMRSTCGVICASDSLDGGQTWAPIRRTCLPHNNSGIDLARSLRGTLLLACNPVVAPDQRSPLSLVASLDNGGSWDRVHELETGPGEYSYPAVIATPEGFAGVYTWKRERIAFWTGHA
jgi:predicted neuraminidase